MNLHRVFSVICTLALILLCMGFFMISAAPVGHEGSKKKTKQMGKKKEMLLRDKSLTFVNISRNGASLPQLHSTMASSTAVCHYGEASLDVASTNSTSSEIPQRGWEFYTKFPQCPLIRQVTCGTPNSIPEGPLQRKGRALVMMMLKSFDEEAQTTEWSNIEFFIQMGYIPADRATVLFESVDFVFYRINTEVTVVTLSAVVDNVQLYFVPPCRCDLCAHARVLSHLGYSPPSAGTSSSISSSFPYKSIIMLNSGVRGPIGNDASGDWVDIVSMAGETTRPQTMREDIAQHFTTVAGTKLNIEPPLRDTEIPMHLQSYFLVIPISSLPVYHRLFLEGGCDTQSPYDDLPSKVSCILYAEIRTISEFVDPARNRLVDPSKSSTGTELEKKKTNEAERGRGGDHNYRVYSFGRRAMFELKDNHNTSTMRAWWRAHVEKFTWSDTARKEYVDPCMAVFVKFGGEIFPFQGTAFHIAVSHVSRRLTLAHHQRHHSHHNGTEVPVEVVESLLRLFGPDIKGVG